MSAPPPDVGIAGTVPLPADRPRRGLELRPVTDVVAVPGGFEVSGAGPLIVAAPRSGGPVPAGWVIVEHDAGAPFTLLFDQGRGVDRPGRARVAAAKEGRGVHLIGLPPSSLPLRLVPGGGVRHFDLTRFEVYTLGTWPMFFFLLEWRRRENGVWGLVKDLGWALLHVARGPGSALIQARLDQQQALLREAAARSVGPSGDAAGGERSDVLERAEHRDRTRLLLAAFLMDGRPLSFPPVSRPDVSIVVVLYGQADLTLACLRSIVKQQGPSVEVLIFDNASTDDTGRLLALIEGATVTRSAENLGFLRAVNAAARQASGQAVLLLNSDAELQDGTLAAAFRTLMGEDDVGAVGARTVLLDDTLQEAGSIVWRDGSCVGYGRGDDPDAPPYRFRRDVDYCSGVFLLIRRSLWEQLGGFDDAYAPAYYEEVDFCLRAQAAGWRVVYEPEATIRHYEFASSSQTQAVELQLRNRSRLLAAHYDALARRLEPAPENVLTARTPGGAGRRILVLDDMVPHPFEGSGFPRLLAILELLIEQGFEVTFYPTQYPDEDWPLVYQVVPPVVEVMVGWGTARLEEFLVERGGASPGGGVVPGMPRQGFYRALLVSRPHNMKTVARIRKRWPELFAGTRLIYDAEALFAMRDVARARLRGERSALARAERELQAEVELVRFADRVTAASAPEREQFVRRGVGEVTVLPHAIASTPTPEPFSARRFFLFVGPLRPASTPNVDSLTWLLDRVWPRLRERLPDCELVVVGRNQNRALLARRDSGVRFAGTVDDLAPLYGAARVFVAPTRFSAGVPLKIIEAAAHGLPVVATDLLAEQLGWVPGEHLLSGPVSDADAFVENCVRLHGDEELWGRLRAGALERVRAECDPRVMAEVLRGLLWKG